MMLISVSLNLLFLTLFIRSFSEFKNNKFVLPAYIIVVLIQWYLNQNGMTFYGRWDYSTFESMLHYVYVQR